MVFRGSQVLLLDGKGRLTVPSRWRDLLMANVNGQLVVNKSTDGCLSLYPLPVWEKIEDKLMDLPVELDDWRRIYMGSADSVEIDSAARVLIPPHLRDWAGLEREVLFMGVGAYFELWDMAAYQEREKATRAKERPEALRNLVVR